MQNKVTERIEARARQAIRIRGVVQGVGFRPFVYRLAQEHGLYGWVRNTSAGVEIEVEGSAEALAAFRRDLELDAPPLARIESVEISEVLPPAGYEDFQIRPSEPQQGPYQLISPDIATCADCVRELFDPTDRRYRYPFINCTNCGPRFTIIEDIPYDRPLTTMREFTMCPDCQREYDNPLDRRFHAQPNACPVCGPSLTLTDNQGRPLLVEDVIIMAAQLLRQGHILAIKGLGGFHLACDATNETVVQRLRHRKNRPDKPFAVMMATLEEVRAHCQASPQELTLLTSPQCPIVLLPWRPDSPICQAVAPRYRYLGVMLPYTPLHHLLLCEAGRPLVMTSGNLSEEPIAQDNEEALQRLGNLADYFILHNRGIYARYDDSVWFVPSGGPQPIRRARGYAPFPIILPFELPQVLACGPELKNTFCLTKDRYAFLSQHIGDMENLETLAHFERTIMLYRKLFRITPTIIAHDLHPDYLATRYALEQAARDARLQLVSVQHHYAHIVSCLADNNVGKNEGPVIGVAFDGTGYGADGAIWGGEFLIADYNSWRRAAHLEYLPLAGGEAAIHNPYRLAIAYSYALQGEAPDVPTLQDVPPEEIAVIGQQVVRGLNAPPTSSCGRLFDAVAALLGVCKQASYEAQAAVELEMLASGVISEGCGYPFDIDSSVSDEERTRALADLTCLAPPVGEEVKPLHVIRLGDTWQAILADIQAGVTPSLISWRFHRTIAQMILETCQQLSAESGLRTVALSGGCFQNRLLLKLALPLLQEAGFRVLLHRQVPCNDGGVSLGQAIVAGLKG